MLGVAWWEVHRRHGADHRVRPAAVRIEWSELRAWRPVLSIRFTLRARHGQPPAVSSTWWTPFPPRAP